jgi:mRNA-degrading endonuclease RelE of RelBE toxin-antitoxin system
MKWTVLWHPEASDKLAEVWLHADNRRAVTQSTHRIELALHEDADKKGVDFYGDRLLVEPPLSVVYRVSAPDRTVMILDVQHHRA